jgi:CheY-like chemotaxis protein
MTPDASGARIVQRLHAVASVTSHMEPPRKGRALRIVVVEDHDDGREMLHMMLQVLGHDVVSAADGQAGLDLILMLEPDVALVDLGLPKLDGYEVARQVTEIKRFQHTRLIALTGRSSPEDKWKSLEAGFDDHMVKPIDPRELEQKLAELAAIVEPR